MDARPDPWSALDEAVSDEALPAASRFVPAVAAAVVAFLPRRLSLSIS
jgi:hypothetical protein